MKMQVKNGLAARFPRVLQNVEAARFCRAEERLRKPWKGSGQLREQVRRHVENAFNVTFGNEEAMSGRQWVDIQKRQHFSGFQNP